MIYNYFAQAYLVTIGPWLIVHILDMPLQRRPVRMGAASTPLAL